jgi:solute carrier family 25 (mitochondrial folate transporter), member 32
LDYLSASTISGTLTAILTNPIWVVKTRMLSTSSTSTGAYPSMLRGLVSIYATEGLRGYFAGLTPALFGVSHGALMFVAYERLKAWRRASHADGQLTNLDTIVTSSLAKVWAGTLTYPHQLVRTRMQTFEPRMGVRLGLMGVIRRVWVEEGVMAFYKGLGPNLLRVVPSTCVTFLVYENVRYGLPRMWAGDEKEI